jgi:peroxiredoxin
MAQRVTFVIDSTGRIRHVDRAVDVSKHGADLAGVLRGLQGQR